MPTITPARLCVLIAALFSGTGCDSSGPTDTDVLGTYTLTVSGFEARSGRARGQVGGNGLQASYRVISNVSLIDLPSIGGVTVAIRLSSVPSTPGMYGIAREEQTGCGDRTSGTGPGAEALASLYIVSPSNASACLPVVFGGTVEVLASDDDDVRLTFDMTGLSNTRGVLPDTLHVSGAIALGASAR